MARRGGLAGWTVIREYHPELDPDGTLCASALADLYHGLKAQGLKARELDAVEQGETPDHQGNRTEPFWSGPPGPPIRDLPRPTTGASNQ
jgi:hypothetical protein